MYSRGDFKAMIWVLLLFGAGVGACGTLFGSKACSQYELKIEKKP